MCIYTHTILGPEVVVGKAARPLQGRGGITDAFQISNITYCCYCCDCYVCMLIVIIITTIIIIIIIIIVIIIIIIIVTIAIITVSFQKVMFVFVA